MVIPPTWPLRRSIHTAKMRQEEAQWPPGSCLRSAPHARLTAVGPSPAFCCNSFDSPYQPIIKISRNGIALLLLPLFRNILLLSIQIDGIGRIDGGRRQDPASKVLKSGQTPETCPTTLPDRKQLKRAARSPSLFKARPCFAASFGVKLRLFRSRQTFRQRIEIGLNSRPFPALYTRARSPLGSGVVLHCRPEGQTVFRP
jgi:hypothetical protein